MRPSRLLSRLAAAAVLAAAAGALAPVAPASAATCSTADGVSVVVDFHELGGGVQSGCVADGGGQTGTTLLTSAGFSLDYVQSQPGFVCRVDGQPASDPCVRTPPSDAYWALWWSDGTSGRWTYATTGAGSLRVPEGGYVALSWNGSSSRSTPGVAPSPHPVAPPASATPSAHPSSAHPTTSTGHHTSAPTVTPSATGATGASAAPSATPTGSATSEPGKRHRPPSSSPTTSTGVAEPTASSSSSSSPGPAVTASDPARAGDNGLPSWAAPVVIVLLFGAVGVGAVVRRRRGSLRP